MSVKMKLHGLLSIYFILAALVTDFSSGKQSAKKRSQGLISVKLVKVLDGDTIDVKPPSGGKLRIRFRWIDAPEKKQAYGQEAKRFLIDILKGHDLLLDSSETGPYGRIIGVIFSGDLDVNKAMVDNGYAWCYKMDCPEDYMTGMQEAQDEEIGLWQDENPIAPWDFRKRRKKPKKIVHQTNDEIVASIPAIKLKTRGTTKYVVQLGYVYDGDTITVYDKKTQEQMKIRMQYIDAPEKAQEAGIASTNFLKQLLKESARKKLVIRSTGKDRYGRYLGVVKLGRRDVNKLMVSKGFAWCYKTGCPKSYLAGMKKAKASGLGLWASATAQAPWIYRRDKKLRRQKAT